MDLLIGVALFILGFTGSVMGNVLGSALIVVPGMLALGLPPHATLGTIRPAYFFDALVSAWRFKKRGYAQIKEGLPMLISSFGGALLGAYGILQVTENIVKYIIVAIVLIASILLLVKKKAGETEGRRTHSTTKLAVIGFFAGVMSGAFGVGTGIVAAITLIFIEGYTIKQSFALGKVRAIGNQAAALAIFGISSVIIWDAALVLLLGSLVGSYLGVELVHRMSDKRIKYIFIFGSILLALKVLFF